MGEIAGKTALVTGAARRIGREIALALAAEGAHCLLHYDRSKEAIEKTAEECRTAGVRAETLPADLRAPGAAEALAAAAAERGAGILVHNASTFSRTPFFETGVAEHREVLERDLGLHVIAPYLLARVLGARMAEAGWGRIVLLGDWSAGAGAYRHYAPYVTSKAAVPMLARVLALELGARSPSVTVNAVLPGPILPPEGQDPADFEMVKRQTILGEWVGARDVARSVVFLLSSPGITGESLRVDGGRAAKAL